ncbi:hypothetical protein [Geodermatophilus sp. SYSU D00691]
MAAKAFRCRMGLHAYVKAHPADERPHGPDAAEVCLRCGKRREGTIGGLPPGVVS